MARDDHNNLLRSVPMFADLDEQELNAILNVATDLNIAAGTVLMREGGMAHEMVVVLTGTLEVTKDGEFVADIGDGGIAGEMALLTEARRNATVTAKTDVQALHIDGREFGSLLDTAPHIAVKMLPIVAGRVVDNSEHHSH